jgi:hypothetical protein
LLTIIAFQNVGVRCLLRLAVVAVSAAVLGAGGSACSRPASPAAACVDHATAEHIWRTLDDRLNAVVRDPRHAGLELVVTGNALDKDRQYIQQQLVSRHLTEHEVNRLDSLTILDAACGGSALRARISLTLVQDDYLAPDGHVDHPDAQVGGTFRLIETFVRSGSSWKESDFINADQPAPSPTPQLLGRQAAIL